MILRILAAIGFLISTVHAQPAWSYVGIPYTDWEYDPFTKAAPTRPAEWPSAGKADYYFIEPDHPNATNTVLSGEPVDSRGKRFGYPDRPRLDFPLYNNNFNTFHVPGTVFWMKGGSWNTVYGTKVNLNMSLKGTAAAPCWIYGDPDDKPRWKQARVALYNSAHTFVENIIWDAHDGTGGLGGISVGRNDQNDTNPDSLGASHHLVFRHLRFEDRPYTDNGAFIQVQAPLTPLFPYQNELHDVVCYDVIMKGCGHGVDFAGSTDADMHGLKFNGHHDVNRAYRIWMIECRAIKGDTPDPVDGMYKSIAGSFIQIGDQAPSEGLIDHVYVAGCYAENLRQSLVGTKRCGHIIASSNTGVDWAQSTTAQGQAFNSKYDRQENQWFINNYVENSDAFYIRAEATTSTGIDTFLPADTRIYVVGNIFKNCTRLPYDTPNAGGIGGRKSKGICIQEMRGKVYIANNIVDDSPYGVYCPADADRQSTGSEVYIYNNIFTNIDGAGDASAASGSAIAILDTDSAGHMNGNTVFYSQNNLSDVDKYWYNGAAYTTTAFNALANAVGNFQDDPEFVDAGADNYALAPTSPAIDAGVNPMTLGTGPDVYQLFIDAFSDDPDFPGEPQDVWPRSYPNASRIEGVGIDIGAYEYGSGAVVPPVGSATATSVTTTSVIITP